MIQPQKKHALIEFVRSLQQQIDSAGLTHNLPPHHVPDIFKRTGCRQLHETSNNSKPVFLCIGTELVNGDSLGPLVGYQLSRRNPPQAYVYGTLQKPIHALNLETQIMEIKRKHPGSCIIAIDASFGSKRQLGAVSIRPGPLYPGLGVEKELPPVGDISITGIVCTHGPHCNERLRDTPLSLLIPQVDMITEGIIQMLSLSDIHPGRQDRISEAVLLPDRIHRIHR